jgi:transposase
MLRKNFYVENQICVLCEDETRVSMMHLFFQCDFSQNFWWRIGEEWNTELDIIDMIVEAKHRYLNKFFKEAMIAGCWSIWNQRNSIIFYEKTIDVDRCFSFFRESIATIRHRVKPGLKKGMQDWLDIL